MKKWIEIYNTFGKGDNPDLREARAIEDTVKERAKIIEELGNFDYWNKGNFINQKTDNCTFDIPFSDWDEPTGGYIEIMTYEEKKVVLKRNTKLI